MSESSESEKSEKPMTDAERLSAANAAAAEQLELKLPGESSAPKDLALWAGVLVLLTMIAYWPATSGSFLWRDDATATSPLAVGAGGMSRIWLERWQNPKNYSQAVYQPVALTCWWLEYQLGGHTPEGFAEPMAYHIASLILHAGAAILLWLLLRELNLPGSWLIAGIFALHPLHAEPVSWISEQPIVLAGLFFIGSVYCYLLFLKFLDRDQTDRATGQPGVDPAQTWGLFAGSILLSLLAILSHPSTVVLPLIILLIIWWKRPLLAREIAIWTALFFVGLILWFKNADLHSVSVSPSLIHLSPMLQAAEIGRGLALSVIRLILPVRLSILYPSSGSMLGLLPLGLMILLLIVLFLRHSARSKSGFVAFAIFALLIAASINWFDSSRLSVISDGTAYLAMVPMVAVLIFFASDVIRSGGFVSAPPLVACSTVLLLAVGLPAWVRTHVFESPVAMWRDTLSKHRDSVLAEASLAEQLRLLALVDTTDQNKEAMDADFTEAIVHAKSAIQLDPTNAQAQHTWASILVAQGDDAGALAHFQAGIRSDPNNPQMRAEYGSALITLGQFQAAIPQLNQALVQDFASGIAHRLLGKAYFGLGNIDRTITEEKTALSISPTDWAAREVLGDAQAKSGKLKDAIESYVGVLSDPTQKSRADIWMDIARIKDRQGDYDLAVEYMQTAQKCAPEDEAIKKELAAAIKQKQWAASTRPATRSTTAPATTPSSPL